MAVYVRFVNLLFVFRQMIFYFHKNLIKNTMKKTVIAFILCVLPFLCTSCFKEADLGFPGIVIFDSEGGEKAVSGKISFTHADIHDYTTGEQGETTEAGDGTYYNTCRWLKVRYNDIRYSDTSNKELKIIAEPNTTGKSRILYVVIYSGPKYDEIKVVQK